MQPLEIRLQPSRWLRWALVAAHLGALVVFVTMPLPGWVKAVAIASVPASLGYVLWCHVMLRHSANVAVVKLTLKGMEVMLRSGVWMKADVLDSSFVAPWLVVLHLKLAGRRSLLPVVLLPDAMEREDFRKLRVWLRWSGALRHGADNPRML